MAYKRVRRLHFVNHLSGREIAESCGDCSKTTVNEFLKHFRECPELIYTLPEDVTNEYNTFFSENEYGLKYDIAVAQMFVIEGMDKVRHVISKNRKRKLTKHKKD